MLKSDFDFSLPPSLIAQYPVAKRSASRLLYLHGDSGDLKDLLFTDILTLLHPGDLLVFNDTKVIPARLFGRKPTGGKVELLVERLLQDHRALVHIKASKSPKAGTCITVEEVIPIRVLGRDGDLFEVEFETTMPMLDLLEEYGHMPLPPYIEREDALEDKQRYQTVYAKSPGAVAAPTAGLHFDEPLLRALQKQGVDSAFVTLHVGAGTFQPVRVENIEHHKMHAEYAEVSPKVCEQIRAAKSRGGRVIAVGTTSVRSLESAARSGDIQPFKGDTEIFIKPGVPFHVVDVMITNFHLPESTLLMLVCAFAGFDHTMQAYAHAVEQNYRFFSYGDAMFISKKSV